MERTVSSERIHATVARDPDMPHLRVQQAVHQLPVDQAAATDSRANRQVDECIQPSSRPPAMLAKRWDQALLVYCFIASIAPMWLLLQPRGVIGATFLYATLAFGVRDGPGPSQYACGME